MKTIIRKRVWIALAAIVLLLAGVILYPRKESQAMVSEFGKYQGYSTPSYDGAKKTSDFLALSDGTRLAYDLFLPTKKGVPADTRLPALFKYTPYDRAWTAFDKNGRFILADLGMPWYYGPMVRARGLLVPNGQVLDALWRTKWLGDMVNSGYAVIVVDRPGTGASFGQYVGDPDQVAGETDQILNWIAAQSWSDGSIGMFGDSIQAQVQFRAASTGNPHLKAIFPATTWMDNYSAVVFPGGILDKNFSSFYSKVNQAFDEMATPVDGDTDGTLLAQARAERHGTVALSAGVADIASLPYRDSLLSNGQEMWIQEQTLYPLLDRINRAAVPVYLINGWYDLYARDNFLIYNNLTGPKRLLVRPTDHAGIEAPASDIDYGAEAHRWFDYWLKGIDNGIMKEPPIHYYLQGAQKGEEWQSTYEWPLKDQAMTRFYFGPGDPQGKTSLNNGLLAASLPTQPQAFDAYRVDYSTTTGPTPLWTGVAMPHQYPNLRSHDAKALTYSTLPLKSALTITGHPIAHVWLSTDAPDLDIFVYLEEVDERGNSTYISEGSLRASHRAQSPAPFNDFGLPWRNHFQSELQPIPQGTPMELIFDLRPTAWKFSPGKEMRITIAFADSGNFDTPVLMPAPTLQILRDAQHPSYVDMPVAP